MKIKGWRSYSWRNQKGYEERGERERRREKRRKDRALIGPICMTLFRSSEVPQTFPNKDKNGGNTKASCGPSERAEKRERSE